MHRLGTAAAIAALLCACAVPRGQQEQADSTAADTAAAAGTVVPDTITESVDPLLREVRLACDRVTAYWGQHPGATVRSYDSVMVIPRSRNTADACMVAVRVEEDGGGGAGDLRAPFASSGWARLWEFEADGPDGRSAVFQLVPVRCLVEERWDGGDDADDTYLPAPWFEQRVACWRR